jgi:DNA-binding MarR family transcriptional regulator
MNYFSENSSNTMSLFMHFFQAEATIIRVSTGCKKAVPVYFSLVYHFSICPGEDSFSFGYGYLAQMAGCSKNSVSRILKLLIEQQLIRVKIVGAQNARCSFIYLEKNGLWDIEKMKNKIGRLYLDYVNGKDTPVVLNRYDNLYRNDRISELDSDTRRLSQVKDEERTRGRLLPSDPPLAAYAAADDNESPLPIARWGGQDSTRINKFYNALKTELLKKYDPKELEKLISRSLQSIKSRTQIKDLNAYLNATKKTMIAQLDRSLKKKPKTQAVLTETAQEKESLLPEVMELTEGEKKAMERQKDREINARYKALMGFNMRGYVEDDDETEKL